MSAVQSMPNWAAMQAAAAAAAARPNPVTPVELRRAVFSAYSKAQADARANGCAFGRDRFTDVVLSAVPGGRIDPDHPAAKTLVDIFVEYLVGADPTRLDDTERYIIGALTRWSDDRMCDGRWEELVRPRAVQRMGQLFRWNHDGTEAGGEEVPLVRGLLYTGQPCVFGGQHKAMKTTLACDLAAALLTGTKFLGMQVVHPHSVIYLIQERTKREVNDLIFMSTMRRDEGFEFEDSDRPHLFITDNRDFLLKNAGRRLLRSYFDNFGRVVVFVDPLYLFQTEGNMTDLAAAGKRLRKLCEPIVAGGATPVIVHHTKRDTPVGEWSNLGDLTGAGIAEFARSWLLVSREKEYDGGKVHDLLTVAGTCRGDHARMKVRLDEATMETTVGEDKPTAKASNGITPAVKRAHR